MDNTVLMADTRDMYMAHAMLRREFSLLPQLVRDVAPGNVARAEIVGSHIQLVNLILQLHHEGEDKVLWPLLHARGGAAAEAIVAVMKEQHAVIDRCSTEVARSVPHWRTRAVGTAELATTLESLRDALFEHMSVEEEKMLPLAAQYVTAAEWKQLGEHGMRGTPKSQLPLTFGMVMYEGDPEVVASVLADAPWPVRLLIPRIGRRRYAQHAKRVHGTATPPRFSSSSPRGV